MALLVSSQSALIHIGLTLDAGVADAAQALVLIPFLVDDAVGVVQADADRTEGLLPALGHAVADLGVEEGAGGARHAHKDPHLGAHYVLGVVLGVGERLDLGQPQHLFRARVLLRGQNSLEWRGRCRCGRCGRCGCGCSLENQLRDSAISVQVSCGVTVG